MVEFDLNDIWNKENQNSESFFKVIEPQLESLIERRSSDILSKIKRNIKLEMIVFVPSLPLLYFLEDGLQFSWLIIISLIIINSISLFPYIAFFRRLEGIQIKDVLNSLKAKRDILHLLLLRLKILCRILFSLLFFFGLRLFVTIQNRIWTDLLDWRMLIVIVVIVLFILLLDWLINQKYYYQLYTKYIEEYDELIANLQDGRAKLKD